MNKTLKTVTAKVTRTIDLGDLEEAWRGAVFEVWVTPTREHVNKLREYNIWIAEHIPDLDSNEGKAALEKMGEEALAALYDEADKRLADWLADTWLNMPLEDIVQLREHLRDTSANDVWNWLYRQTIDVMATYREGLIKNSLAPSTAT